MELVKYEYCFLIKDFFSPNIVAGFTRPNLDGNLPYDIYKALSFLNKPFILSYMNQTHSSNVRFIDQAGVYNSDALFTKGENHLIAVRTADCLPIFFSDDKSNTIGIVHMGWRSAEKGILNDVLCDLSSSKIVAGIGLRNCCYEVKEDFLKSSLLANHTNKQDKKFYFNPIKFAKRQLNIDENRKKDFLDLGICSFHSKEGFFSYRRDKTTHRTISFALRVA